MQATVEDLDPPPALSVSPKHQIASALLAAYERDYTHLTVVSSTTRLLIGYLSMPRRRLNRCMAADTGSDSVTTPWCSNALSRGILR